MFRLIDKHICIPCFCVYAMSKKGSKREFCTSCGVVMRRLYVGKSGRNAAGKRIHRHIPVGYICIYCEAVKLDHNIREHF